MLPAASSPVMVVATRPSGSFATACQVPSGAAMAPATPSLWETVTAVPGSAVPAELDGAAGHQAPGLGRGDRELRGRRVHVEVPAARDRAREDVAAAEADVHRVGPVGELRRRDQGEPAVGAADTRGGVASVHADAQVAETGPLGHLEGDRRAGVGDTALPGAGTVAVTVGRSTSCQTANARATRRATAAIARVMTPPRREPRTCTSNLRTDPRDPSSDGGCDPGAGHLQLEGRFTARGAFPFTDCSSDGSPSFTRCGRHCRS